MLDKNDWENALCDYLTDHEQKCNDIGRHFQTSWRTSNFCPLECNGSTNLVFNSMAPSSKFGCMKTSENCLLDTPHECKSGGPYSGYPDPGGKCYRDGPQRDLSGIESLTIPSNEPNSIQWCQNQCAINNYIYAGVQFSKYCFCGNTFNRHGTPNQDECNMYCEDQQKNICGGSWRNNVYFAISGPTEARCACPADKPIWDSSLEVCVEKCPVRLTNARFGDGLYWEDQSSTPQTEYKPEYAIDGIIQYPTNRQNSNMAHSKSSNNPIFYTDLVISCNVKKVRIYPNRNGNFDRYFNMEVYLNNSLGTPIKCFPEANWKNNEAFISSRLDIGLIYHCYYTGMTDSIMVSNDDYIMLGEVGVEC